MTNSSMSPSVRPDALGLVLWVLLVASVLGNATASFVSGGTAVHLACGLVTAFTVTTMVVRHVRAGR